MWWIISLLSTVPTPQALDAEHCLLDPVAGCRRATPAEIAHLDEARQTRRQAPRILAGAGGAGGLDVRFAMSPAVSQEAAFVVGLEEAARIWEAIVLDPVTITMDIDFVRGPSYVASTSRLRYAWQYAALRQALIANAAPESQQFLAAMPGVMRFETPGGEVTTSASPAVAVGDSVYQALGFPSLDTDGSLDVSVLFNLDFDFDPDPSDGVSPGHYDLVAIMAHEIGHALGFSSTVDTSQAAYPTPLDLFRMGALGADNDPDGLNDIASMARERRPGVEAAIDTVGAIEWFADPLRLSTGAVAGDGRQASHWKDDALLGTSAAIGLMDPTYTGARLTPGYVSRNDLVALSLIGWSIPGAYPRACSAADITTDGESSGVPDGAVTQSDFAFYIALWDARDPRADVTIDGDCLIGSGGDGVTLSDLSCYLALWNAGCP